LTMYWTAFILIGFFRSRVSNQPE
jgi:hypothetical protein